MLKPKKVDISAAYRIKEFSMGSLDAGYSNTNLEEVSFKNNRMLERLEVQNCPTIANALDLRAATNLKYLDIHNFDTFISSYFFPRISQPYQSILQPVFLSLHRSHVPNYQCNNLPQ